MFKKVMLFIFIIIIVTFGSIIIYKTYQHTSSYIENEPIESITTTTIIPKETINDYLKNSTLLYVKEDTSVFNMDDNRSKKIAMINKGETVSSIKVLDSGYNEVIYSNSLAYIASSNLSSTPIAIKGYTEIDDIVYPIDTTHIYDEPNTNSKVIATLNNEDKLKRIGYDNKFSEIIYNGSIGYAKNTEITNTQEISGPVKENQERKINTNKKMVALTFDDGPNPISTNKILDTLESYNVVATFFDLGTLMERYPNVTQREEKIGCEVGTHTYSHVNLNTLNGDALQIEINKSNDVFERVLGHQPTLTRPPYGNANALVKSTVQTPLINWDVDTLDWKTRNVDSLIANIDSYSTLDGRIILMHSIYGTTADAVKILVPKLINEGYELVTVSELAKYKGYTLEPGHIYYDFRN